jgi:hypothetical protein
VHCGQHPLKLSTFLKKSGKYITLYRLDH